MLFSIALLVNNILIRIHVIKNSANHLVSSSVDIALRAISMDDLGFSMQLRCSKKPSLDAVDNR